MAATAKKRKKKRRSQAPVALVYFITVIIFMALLGLVSVYLLKEFGIIGEKDEDEAVVSSPVYTDLFARVNSKGVLSDMTVIRIDPENERITVVPISAITVTSVNKTRTMRDVFADSGMVGVRDAVEETFGISIDNYMSLTNDAFERVADLIGGIVYTPNEELYYLSQENDNNDISIAKGELVNLSGRQIRLITQYPVFKAGKEGNNKFLGEAVTMLINNAFQQSKITVDNLDNIYQIMSSNSDTDMTNDDWKLQKSYIKEMLQSSMVPGDTLLPEGTWNGDERFELSSESKAAIRERFAEFTISGADEEGNAQEDDQESREAPKETTARELKETMSPEDEEALENENETQDEEAGETEE